MSRKEKVTILVPTLNEIEAVQVVMPQIQNEWADEIIVVDGGSTDGTVEYMTKRGYKIHSQSGRGYGTGMKQGLMLAQGEIIIEYLPDGNSIASAIPALIAKVEEGYDLVIASRYKDSAKSDDDDVVTGFGNWMFTTMVNILFNAKYTDVLVGFRAYRKSSALKLELDTFGLSWPCQTSDRFAAAGMRIAEVAVDEPKRIGGVRKMRPLKTGWEVLMLIFRDFAWSLKNRSKFKTSALPSEQKH